MRPLPNIEIMREHFALREDHPQTVVWRHRPNCDASVPDLWLPDRRYVVLAYIAVPVEDVIRALTTGEWVEGAASWHVHDTGADAPSLHITAWQHALEQLRLNSEAIGVGAGADRATDAGAAKRVRDHRHHNFPDGGVQVAVAGQKETIA